jgi:hypothetical protein
LREIASHPLGARNDRADKHLIEESLNLGLYESGLKFQDAGNRYLIANRTSYIQGVINFLF